MMALFYKIKMCVLLGSQSYIRLHCVTTFHLRKLSQHAGKPRLSEQVSNSTHMALCDTL